jgi:hypothetical protein
MALECNLPPGTRSRHLCLYLTILHTLPVECSSTCTMEFRIQHDMEPGALGTWHSSRPKYLYRNTQLDFLRSPDGLNGKSIRIRHLLSVVLELLSNRE